ncbi:hypothetical protein AB1Y20_007638 [Prymnesium parvum]|uniref:Uncharacterized protein n=1 Tax=Prymnesium parvum TaxID=97485 RepID=A0AB34IVL5_PRYPA
MSRVLLPPREGEGGEGGVMREAALRDSAAAGEAPLRSMRAPHRRLAEDGVLFVRGVADELQSVRRRASWGTRVPRDVNDAEQSDDCEEDSRKRAYD